MCLEMSDNNDDREYKCTPKTKINKTQKKPGLYSPGFLFDKFYLIKLTVHLAFGSILSLELLQFVCLRFHHF